MIGFGLMHAWNVLQSACVYWNVLMTEMMACLIPMAQKIVFSNDRLDANCETIR